jgi:uncharacterized OB-fold protein
MASTALTTGSVAPLRQRQTMEFPYKHSTGETVGRFLAGLKEQKKIWGQRVSGQGVVVPPLGYSEIDGSNAGEWVEVKDTGVVTAVARVDHPIERLHPSTKPFAFVLVKLDGADTGLAHIVRDDLDRVAVGARVKAVWAPDESRIGSIRDIDSFRVIADAPPPKVKPAPAPKPVAKPTPAKVAKVTAGAKAKTSARKARTTKSTKITKATKPAKSKTQKKTAKTAKAGKVQKKPAVAKKTRKIVRAKAVKPARAKARKPAKPARTKKPRTAKKPAKTARKKTSKRLRHR